MVRKSLVEATQSVKMTWATHCYPREEVDDEGWTTTPDLIKQIQVYLTHKFFKDTKSKPNIAIK